MIANDSETDYSGNVGNNSRPETIYIVNCAINAPLIVTSIIGNTLVLAAILKTPSLRSPSTILLCSLAVSDLLVGLIVQPVYIAYRLTRNVSLDHALSIMAFSVCGVSLLTMTAISVDRFLALYYHMRYPNLMTTRRAMYALATAWVLCFLLSLIYFRNERAYYLALAVSVVVCLFTCSVCYVRIYRIVRQHQRHIDAQQQAVESNPNMQRSTKSAVNTFIYYVVMVLCYTPLLISMLLSAISPDKWTKTLILAETVVFMNSSINPFLYCWRLHELRTAVIKTARQILCKETEENSLT